MHSLDAIIIGRNVSDYIEQTIESLTRARSKLDLRIIMVDDGSTDETLAKVKYCDQASRLNMTILQTESVGPSAARNEALKHLTGADYVCFIDGDDIIDGKGLGRTVSQLAISGAEIAVPMTVAFDDAGRHQFEHDSPHIKHQLLAHRSAVITNVRDTPELLALETSMCMRVFSRDLLNRTNISFPTNISFCEDAPVSRRMLLEAKTVLITKDRYYLYRVNRVGQRTAQISDKSMEMVQALSMLLDESLPRVLDDAQGGWLARRITEMAMWGSSMLPTHLVSKYSQDVAHVLNRVPIGWWRHLQSNEQSHWRSRDIAYLRTQSRSQASNERIIYNGRLRFKDRLYRRLKD